MKRLLFFGLLMTCISLTNAIAQDKTFPEGLKKLSSKEVMDMGIKMQIELPAYGPDFNLLTKEETVKLMTGGEHIPMYYADAKGKLAAILFRALSKHEKAMILEFQAEQARMKALIGTEAKDFEVTDMEGNAIKLSDLRGQVVAVNFWFIGCKPCIMEMPELNEIVKEFDGKPVKFVAIALDKEDALTKFAQKREFNYDIVADGRPVVRLYEVSGYPTHCIIDKEGKIAYFKSAYSPRTATEITETLEKLLHQ